MWRKRNNMTNKIEIFKKEEIGEIRTLEIDGKPYFVASDIAKALGYTNSRKAIKDHCRWVTTVSYTHLRAHETSV